MKKLTLQKLQINNIKGVEHIEIDLSQDGALFYQPNGWGKTTALDTIIWLLTGNKNLRNEQFSPDSLIFPENTEQSASLEFTLDKVNHILTIARPNQTAALDYFFDENKVTKSIYLQNLITLGLDNIMCLVNPYYLLDVLTWQDAREVMMALNIRPTKAEITSFLVKKGYVQSEVDTLEYENKFSKDTINTNLRHLKDKISIKTQMIDSYEKTILNTKQDKIARLKIENRIMEINAEIAQFKANSKTEIAEYQQRMTKDIDMLKGYTTERERLTMQLAKQSALYQDHLRQINETSEVKTKLDTTYTHLSHDNEYAKCPTCKQPLVNGEEMHAQRMLKIQEDSYALGQLLKELATNCDAVKAQMNVISTEINDFDTKNRPLMEQLAMRISECNDKILEFQNPKNYFQLTNELSTLQNQLASEQEFKTLENLRNNLITEKEQLNQELMRWKNLENAATDAVLFENQYFKTITSKYFPDLEIIIVKVQKNGKENNTFTVSYDGIPFKQLNFSSKLVVGKLMCDGLQQLAGVKAPILVDNLESLDDFTKLHGLNVIGAMVRKVN